MDDRIADVKGLGFAAVGIALLGMGLFYPESCRRAAQVE